MTTNRASLNRVTRLGHFSRLAAQLAVVTASSVLLTACYVVPMQPVPLRVAALLSHRLL